LFEGGVMTFRLAVVSLAVVLASTVHAFDLARDGKSNASIILPHEATALEQSAAKELQSYLREITGAKLAIVEETAEKPTTPTIYVGRTKFAEQALAKLDWTSLGHDGVVIKTVGDNLVLAGGQPRGAIYAVETFLEDIVGVRWWTSTEQTIPHKPTLTIGDLDIQHTPTFRYREVFYEDAIHHPDFAVHLKLNGHHNAIPPELGGHYSIIGFCHTSFNYISPGTYFKDHPEWFAMIDGQRQPATQLCWSDEHMQAELAKNVVATIRKDPSAGIISVSQMDGYGPCQCERCQAIVKEEGSEAGPIIRAVNHVAAEVAKEYPDFLVETLAYVYSRTPPKHVKPAKNVLVRLCSYECDFSHPLEGPSNASFGNDLREWAKIAPNLFVWNYVTNFNNYLTPHPNMNSLGQDLRFFAKSNVIGVFEQGDAFNPNVGDFPALRTWLMAHLLWDPSKDQSKLRDEFLQGYYGAAAPYLAQYLDLMNAPAKDPNFRRGLGNPEPDYLSHEAIDQAQKLFDQAELAVRNEATRLRRVKRDRLAIDLTRVMRYDFAAAKKRLNDDRAVESEYEALARKWVSAANAFGVKQSGEVQGIESFGPSLVARDTRFIPPVIPPAGAKLPDGCFDVQEDRFKLYFRPAESDLVEDPQASNGRAARMPGGHNDWAVQFPITKADAFTGPGPWRCHLLVRVDTSRKSGPALLYGLQDNNTARSLFLDRGQLELLGDGKYHALTIAVDELKPNMCFWVAPIGDVNAAKAIYVDRIYIERRSN
jgi:hypothetical protein